jgi:hypothetical protein
MDKTVLFVSGMFRSGTTLLARMLNNHPNIAFASDPLRPLINSFRFDCIRDDSNCSRFAPLYDYFLEYSKLREVIDGKLDLPIGGEQKELWKTIKSSAEPYSNLWADKVDVNNTTDTYAEALDYGLKLISETYSKGISETCIGFKEVWGTEFSSALLQGISNSKCLIIVRDPRAVVASKNSTDEPYPIFFLARQWRKIAFLANKLQQYYPERVHIIRYEDLITDPKLESGKMCEFIGLEMHGDFLDAASFKDGEGKPWSQNSSYTYDNGKQFQTLSVEKWKSKLSDSDVSLTELICHDWMNHFGYQPCNDSQSLLNRATTYFTRLDTAELAEWIKPYNFDESIVEFHKQVTIEKLRLNSVKNEVPLDLADDLQIVVSDS